MKDAGKILLLGLALTLWTASVQAQTIRIANNNANAPTGANVFSTVQAALAAAVDGDIIHIVGSPNNYTGNKTVDKTLTIVGIGFMPNKDNPDESSLTSTLTLTSGVGTNASGTVIEGLSITGTLTIADGISDIKIRKCTINNGNVINESGANHANIEIEDNIFNNAFGATVINLDDPSNSGMIIRNNLFFRGRIEVDNGLIANNTFITNSAVSAIINTNNCLIANNAFFKARPVVASVTNSIYNNNVALGSNDDTMPTPSAPMDSDAGTNNLTGQGNKFIGNLDAGESLNANEFFVTLGDLNGRNAWNANDDYNLHANNPGIGTNPTGGGTDGTDMGAYGGEDPFNILPNYPIIQTLNPTSPIKQGEDLPTSVSAQSN